MRDAGGIGLKFKWWSYYHFFLTDSVFETPYRFLHGQTSKWPEKNQRFNLSICLFQYCFKMRSTLKRVNSCSKSKSIIFPFPHVIRDAGISTFRKVLASVRSIPPIYDFLVNLSGLLRFVKLAAHVTEGILYTFPVTNDLMVTWLCIIKPSPPEIWCKHWRTFWHFQQIIGKFWNRKLLESYNC